MFHNLATMLNCVGHFPVRASKLLADDFRFVMSYHSQFAYQNNPVFKEAETLWFCLINLNMSFELWQVQTALSNI